MKPERDSEIFAVMHAVRGIPAAQIVRLAKRKFRRDISAATVSALRKPVGRGGTKFPQRYTLDTIARVGGLKFALVPVGADVSAPDKPSPRNTRRPQQEARA